jgi:mono/diheme cytochrome c family protein
MNRSRIPSTVLAAMPCLFLAAPLVAGEAPRGSPGEALYTRWCAECHAEGHGHPGTQQLERTRGAKLAVLTQRQDLVPQYVILVVRNGLNAMPPYRPSEISEDELALLAAWLAPQRPLAR